MPGPNGPSAGLVCLVVEHQAIEKATVRMGKGANNQHIDFQFESESSCFLNI